jgi:hypothetical protein
MRALIVLLSLTGCTQATVKLAEETGGADLDGDSGGGQVVDTSGGGETADTGGSIDTGEPPDTSAWDNATLIVNSPHSGDFLPYGETSSFSATVYDADGNATDFDDISWSSDIDAAWSLSGAAVEDASLDVGTHTITATAHLPNGDRLTYAVGGVLVQSPYTGVYTGTLQIDLTAQGYTTTCAGGLTLSVDAYGNAVTGDASCLLSFNGYDLDTSWVFDLANASGALTGASGADLVIFTYDFDTTGAMSEDGSVSGTFGDDVYGVVTVAGSFDATRVSRDVSDGG